MCAAKKKRRNKRRNVRKQFQRSQSAQTTPARIAQTERRLRNKIQRFAFQPQFRRDLDKAQFQFSGKRPSRLHPLVIEDDEIPSFQEWYLFDYPIKKGETPIDIFTREVGPRLRPEERDLLELWQRWNRFRLFEVQQVMPGTGVQVMDLLSDETLDVHDRSASNILERWEIFRGRPLYTDRLHFTGTGIPLPPNKKAAVTAQAGEGSTGSRGPLVRGRGLTPLSQLGRCNPLVEQAGIELPVPGPFSSRKVHAADGTGSSHPPSPGRGGDDGGVHSPPAGVENANRSIRS